MAGTSRVLVYGGKGALGATCVSFFKAKNWWVASVDLVPNEDADANIVVTELQDWEKQDEQVQKRVEEVLAGEKLDAVLCVAGGWAGGSAKSKSFIKNANLMWKQSVWTSCISASIASSHLKEGGLLTLPGAMPALSGTAGMAGYGLAKAAVHQLTKSVAAEKGGLPAEARVLAILPQVRIIESLHKNSGRISEWKKITRKMTLDTPMNRKGMPNADFTSWTPLEFVANLFFNWTEGKDVPDSGSLVQLTTKDGNTSCTTHTSCL